MNRVLLEILVVQNCQEERE